MKLSKANVEMFAQNFQASPFWWEAHRPASEAPSPLTDKTQVAIVGAGYTGLAAALELSKKGVQVTVLDAHAPGYGASTRSGGLVDGLSLFKNPILWQRPDLTLAAQVHAETNKAFRFLENLIQSEAIDCQWQKTGRFVGAWTKRHFQRMQATAERLQSLGYPDVTVVPPEIQSEEIGSAYYHGGIVTGQAGHLHPALLFKGLLDACRNRAVSLCAQTPVTAISKQGGGWTIKTERDELRCDEVIVATNGYTDDATPDFKRRLIPLKAYIIATAPMSANMAKLISPKNRAFSDSKRIVTFFRLSGDPPRLIFGSRVKWRDVTPSEMAPPLYRLMIDRFPQLTGIKITHAWSGNVALTFDEKPHLGQRDGLHYALGCNGSGVAMMTYLGTQLARKIIGQADYSCAFDRPDFPSPPFYSGKPGFWVRSAGHFLSLRDRLDRKLS